MRTVTNDTYRNVESISRQYIRFGIDPIKVLSKAIEEKIRVEELVKDALNEDEPYFLQDNYE